MEKVAKKKPLLSISILVSNRIDTIRKCMESIRPLLEEIPAELIAVDTGSTDGSIEIVKEYADLVVPFVWCNDFAAARNAGLRRAGGEYFLFLDDDEWFEDVSEIITFFKSGEYKKYDCAWYIVRNYTDKDGSAWADTYVGRMSKMVAGLHFEGRVHEHLVPILSNLKVFSCYAHHYGYAFATKEEEKKHSERNVSLILAELKDNPKDIRMAAQLIQEYIAIKRYADAEELCKRIIRENETNLTHPFLQYMIVALPRIKRLWNDLDGAERVMKQISERYPLGELARLVCLTEKISVAREKADAVKILEILPDYFLLLNQVRAMGSQIKKQEVMNFAYYESDELEQDMVSDGIKAMLLSKQFGLAKELFGRIDWEAKERLPFESLVALLQVYAESGQAEAFFPYLARALDNPEMFEESCAGIEDLLLKFPERREAFVCEIEKLHRKEPYFLMLHVEYCFKYAAQEEAKKAIEAYFAASKGEHDGNVAAMLLLCPALFGKVLAYIDYDTFKEAAALCLKENGVQKLSDKLDELEAVWQENKRIYFQYLKMLVSEELVLTSKAITFEQLFGYAKVVLEHAEGYYARKLFEKERERALPRNCRFALCLQEAKSCMESGNRAAWAEHIKQAARVYPPMLHAIQAVLKEEAKKKEEAFVPPEMKQLAEELKKNIRELAGMGRKAEAKELLQGLMQFVPGDAEIEKLKQLLEES